MVAGFVLFLVLLFLLALKGQDSIRDFIAFPKNNSGRDLMLDTPSLISDQQLRELMIDIRKEKNN